VLSEEAEAAEVAVAEAEEDLQEEAEAEAEVGEEEAAEEAAEPHPLIQMTQAGAILQLNGEA